MKIYSGFEEEDTIIARARTGGMCMTLRKWITDPPSGFKYRAFLGEVSVPKFLHMGILKLLDSLMRDSGKRTGIADRPNPIKTTQMESGIEIFLRSG